MYSRKVLTAVFAIALVFTNTVCACGMLPAADVDASAQGQHRQAPMDVGMDMGMADAGPMPMPMPCHGPDDGDDESDAACDHCNDALDSCDSSDYRASAAERDPRLNGSLKADLDDHQIDAVILSAHPPRPPAPPLPQSWRSAPVSFAWIDSPVRRKDRLTE